jgi:hypothetical protein
MKYCSKQGPAMLDILAELISQSLYQLVPFTGGKIFQINGDPLRIASDNNTAPCRAQAPVNLTDILKLDSPAPQDPTLQDGLLG